MNDYVSKILSHDFTRENFKDLFPYLEQLLEEKPYSPSELEKYSFSVMGWIQRLRNCFRDLEHTRV